MPKGKAAEGSPLLVRVGSDRLVNSLSIVIRISDGALSAFVNILPADIKIPLVDIIVQNQPLEKPLIYFSFIWDNLADSSIP